MEYSSDHTGEIPAPTVLWFLSKSVQASVTLTLMYLASCYIHSWY